MISQQNIKFSIKLKSFAFLMALFSFTFLSHSVFAQNTKFTVVLDAGHGGKDPGTVGLQTYKNSYERDIVLKVVKKVGKFLKKEHDIKTVYTRDTNKFIELHKRGKIANKVDADLFISVHCNSAVTNAYGTTTYVLGMGKTAKNLELSKRENDVIMLEDDREKNYKYNPNSQEFLIGLTLMQEDYLERSIEFAGIVQNKFKTVAKRKNRGVNQGNLAVLYDTYMPSVLIEIGFLTNKSEEKFLNTPLGQSKIAEAIYKAILTYKKRLEKNSIEPKTETLIVQTQQKNASKFYKIQIATSRKKIEAKPYNFKGLVGIERVKVGNVYKYFYGVANNVSDARKLRLKAVRKGYKDAFIAKFNFDKSTSDVYKLNYVNPAKKQKTAKTTTKKSEKLTTKSSTSNNVFNGVDFKVQLSSSPKKIETKSYNFRGLKNVERVKVGKYYKYYYGKTSNYDEIKKLHKIATKKGFNGCFIVAIENGKKISVREVLKR
jgi:N-acetylmuramoyl-L-alanine amidase